MKKRISLGVSGSISAYKAADITSQLGKLGYDVHVLMTNSSQAFITPLTLQVLSKNQVHTNILAEHAPDIVAHIDLAKKTDIFIIAPASANIIAKLANGIADDMLSTFSLALGDIPKFIAPAMNTQMFANPIVQNNLERLKEYGYQVIEPKEGLLACGDIGKGALADITTIIDEIESLRK